jgi:hypothetical protein
VAVLKRSGVAALLLVLPGLHADVLAQQSPEGTEGARAFSFGAEADFNSEYVWRGIVLNDRPVAQPTEWFSIHGLNFISSSNLNLTRTPGQARVDATSLTLEYDRGWKRLILEPAVNAYLNQPSGATQNTNTMEGSLKISGLAGPVRVFTRHSFDILNYHGSYFGEAGVDYEKSLAKKAIFDLTLRSGWASSKFNAVYIGADKAAFNFLEPEASLTYFLSPKLYLQPHCEVSRIVDRQLRLYLPNSTAINFGLALGFEF